ncbi:uncharacterized protein EI97DRAFT_437762 [Westerdykella ornata]|uniref:CFEM domain-containing protein n=1 Tax=Westerdykella ornata TaxID=318751 RepID=A0A6A6J4K4_WESOR|nr:uncharacterized protein EI97DRAFT_437762 [Westerdykella ornata]KAF2271510.1 hypothetical protein EI97DRAFT_437762 [Westerdykella ornata]
MALPTTTQCAETPSGTACIPPCGYKCLDAYIIRNSTPCAAREYGCMCGRSDAYKNAACCMTPACPLPSEQSLSLNFLEAFCSTFNHSASYPITVECKDWTAPPVPSEPSNTSPAHTATPVNGKAIGGGVGGGVGGLLALTLGGYLIWRRRTKKKDIADPSTAPTEAGNGTRSDGYVKPELDGREQVLERHELSPQERDMSAHEIAGRERNPQAAAPNIGYQHQMGGIYPWEPVGELSGTPGVSELAVTHTSQTSELPGHGQR